MRVFKFTIENLHYAVSGKDREAALKHLREEVFVSYEASEIESEEEIPKEKWNDKTITVYEDNDQESDPFMCSINDIMDKKFPMLIYTNDPDFLD